MHRLLHSEVVVSPVCTVGRRSILPPSFHIRFPFSSKNMEGGGSTNAFPTKRDSCSRHQPASADNKIGRSSTNLELRSRSDDGNKERYPRSEVPFDICEIVGSRPVKLNKPLIVINKERRKERERAQNSPPLQYLRSGMVVLKNFINLKDQAAIVNKCRDVGIGSGGFYRPEYRDGAKLHLEMMCLGRDWNPQSRSYEERRSFDNAVPPEIPEEFRKLVDGALHVSRDFLQQTDKDIEEVPIMSPDVCIVNFYNRSGRLGLHQDRDESKESLEKGLPVVSFSIGDSAEFMYNDARDVDGAKKLILESGDVLIFGGKSRHIFHGVSSIKPETTPSQLREETKLRPGRLNLTFRQY